MKQIIQIHLEHKKNVIRSIEIPSNSSLKDLHDKIIESLSLNKNEMASFYITNNNLELIKEIPLFQIDEKDNLMEHMQQVKIKDIFSNIGDKLIYIYDFMIMWRFLISYIEKVETSTKSIKIIKSIGKMPKKAPEIIFESNE